MAFMRGKGDLDWGNQIPVLNKTKRVQIAVRKTAEQVLGKAQIGTTSIDRKQYQVYGLEIFLNREQLHLQLEKKPNVGKIELWANTIAHEVAHNFGHTHGTSGNWDDAYPGYFPTELGFCVMSDGKTGSQGK